MASPHIDTRISVEGLQAVDSEVERIRRDENLPAFTSSDLIRRLLTAHFNGEVDFSVPGRGGDQKSADAKARQAVQPRKPKA